MCTFSSDIWTNEETKLLLDRYENYLKKLGPLKKFKTKKAMWAQIASDLKETLKVEKTIQQVENRYKTIIKRKKQVIQNNGKSGSSRQNIEFEHELAKITAQDDSIHPEVLRGVDECIIKQDSNKCKRTVKSIQSILLEINERHEENREQRHRKKMELLKEIGIKNKFVQ